jgi:hypothetical protein
MYIYNSSQYIKFQIEIILINIKVFKSYDFGRKQNILLKYTLKCV